MKNAIKHDLNIEEKTFSTIEISVMWQLHFGCRSQETSNTYTAATPASTVISWLYRLQ